MNSQIAYDAMRHIIAASLAITGTYLVVLSYHTAQYDGLIVAFYWFLASLFLTLFSWNYCMKIVSFVRFVRQFSLDHETKPHTKK